MTLRWRWSATCATCSVAQEPGEATLDGGRVLCPEHLVTPSPGEGLLVGLELLPHQPAAARWLAARRRALLTDQQGLGKTVEILAALPAAAPALVVSPAAGRGVWLEHLERHRPDLTAVSPRRRADWRWPLPGEVVVTTWDSLPDYATDQIPYLILDEVDLAKGRSTKRNDRARRLVRYAGVAWGATGTPLRTTPEDLWQVLRLLGLTRWLADAWPTWSVYAAAMGGRQGDRGWDWDGERDPRCPALLRRVAFGREASEVLSLQGRTSETVSVSLPDETRRACDQALALLAGSGVDLQQALEQALASRRGNLGDLAFATACRSLAVAKVPRLLELVEEHERTRTDPLLVWSRHRAPVEALEHRPGWAAIHGGVTPAGRQRLAARLQAGELRGLALGVLAAGTALTLTAAHRCVWVDLSYSPGANEQAAYRVQRIGQQHRIEDVYLIADHSLDHSLHAILRRRREAQRDVVTESRRRRA